jgi:hypothetical protein
MMGGGADFIPQQQILEKTITVVQNNSILDNIFTIVSIFVGIATIIGVIFTIRWRKKKAN